MYKIILLNLKFTKKYRMFGLFQTTFYFGYMALLSGALGIMCGNK
jgi:transmembrane 9 superfamily protein 3